MLFGRERHARRERHQRRLRVCDNAKRRWHQLTDLRGIDVDVDDLRVRRKRRRLSRDTIVEAAADVEQHVAALNRAIDVHPAVHPRHTEGERVIMRHRAQTMQFGHDRNAGLLGEVAQVAARAGLHDAVASESQRTLCLREQAHRRLYRIAAHHHLRRRRRAIARQVHLHVPSWNAPCCLRVLRDVDQHRPRPPRARDVKRFAKDAGQFLDRCHEKIVLRDRDRDAGDVDFLERIGAKQEARHLSSDRGQWRAVHPRIGDRRHEIRRARPTCPDAHADLTADARIAFGGVSRALLMTAEHVAQLRAVFPHRVVERHDAAARDTEEHIDIFANQRLTHDLRTGARRRRFSAVGGMGRSSCCGGAGLVAH